MGSNDCPHCGQRNSGVEIEGEGDIVCENCGTVLGQGNFRMDVDLVATSRGDYRPSGSRVSSLFGTREKSMLPPRLRYDKGEYAKTIVLQNCRRIRATLQLPESYEQQLIVLVQRAMGNTWHRGQKGKMMVAACVYILCRQNGFPLTLMDIASSEQCDVFKLGKCYGGLTKRLGLHFHEVDPALYLERTCGYLELSSEEKKQVKQHALRMISVAKDDSLNTGRSPSSITAAAILFSLELFNLKTNPENVTTSLGISLVTAKKRLNELKKAFVLLGKKLLPWGNDIDLKNLAKNMPSILQQVEFRQKVKRYQGSAENEDEDKDIECDIKLPPSYVRSSDQRNRRWEKVQRAKARIQKLIKSSEATAKSLSHLPVAMKQEETTNGYDTADLLDQQPLDEEDLLIERLFLQGKEEVEILEGYYESLCAVAMKSEELEEPEVGERDIPDSALKQFIRTPEEVELFKNISQPSSKRMRVK